MTQTRALIQGSTELGLLLSRLQLMQLESYLALLSKWNRIYNLTAVREEKRMVSYHLLDSLALVPHLEGSKRLLDVGSGGGMPGIPIAVACPELAITVLDANQKKTAFLQQVILELRLSNVNVVTSRVERYQPAKGFDRIVSRAFAALAEFVALTQHLLCANGCWLAMKGRYPYEEIAHLPAGSQAVSVLRVSVPGLEAERHLVKVVLQ